MSGHTIRSACVTLVCLMCVAIIGIYIAVGFTIDTNSKINKYINTPAPTPDTSARQQQEIPVAKEHNDGISAEKMLLQAISLQNVLCASVMGNFTECTRANRESYFCMCQAAIQQCKHTDAYCNQDELQGLLHFACNDDLLNFCNKFS